MHDVAKIEVETNPVAVNFLTTTLALSIAHTILVVPNEYDEVLMRRRLFEEGECVVLRRSNVRFPVRLDHGQ